MRLHCILSIGAHLLTIASAFGQDLENNKIYSETKLRAISKTSLFMPGKPIFLNPDTKSSEENVPFDQPFVFKFQKQNPALIVKSIVLVRKSNSSDDRDEIAKEFSAGHTKDTKDENLFLSMPPLKYGSYYELEIMNGPPGTDSTTIYNFTTIPSTNLDRAKQRLSSELGILVAFFKNGPQNIRESSLIFTVNYHLRPVNKDVPLRVYPIHSLRRFSYVMGVTINSMAKENIRKDLVGKSNLLLGLSYQPIDYVKISYGVLFFKEVNPNIIFNEQTRNAYTSYLSLTVDLQLKDLLGGVISVLGFK